MKLFLATAFGQSGAPTGTLINPSVPNGVESNPETFENVQPVLVSTPVPVKHPKPPHRLRGGNVQEQKQSFVVSPDPMQKDTAPPEKKEHH